MEKRNYKRSRSDSDLRVNKKPPPKLQSILKSPSGKFCIKRNRKKKKVRFSKIVKEFYFSKSKF